MFSMGKTDPRLYNRTLASAGMSCVVVTSTFTQLLLRGTDGQQTLVGAMGFYWIVKLLMALSALLVNREEITATKSDTWS